MSILEIKTKVNKETEGLRKLEKRLNTIGRIVFFVIFAVGLVLGIIVGIKSDTTFIIHPGVMIGIFGIILGLFAFAAIVLDKKKVNKKAKEVSMGELLPLFSKAFEKIVKDEQSILTFEHYLKETMEKRSITWFNDDHELETDWRFPIKDLECNALNKKRYIRKVAINEDLSSSNKIVIEFTCTTAGESTDGVEELTGQNFLVSIG